MISIFTTRLLCFLLVCGTLVPLKAVSQFADDPYEVCASSNDGEFLILFLEAIREKNYVKIRELLKNSEIQKIINTVAVFFIPQGKIVSTLPLLQAVITGDPKIVETLLDAGANPVCRAPNFYITPFHLAASYDTVKQNFTHNCLSYNKNIISPESAEKIFELLINHIHKSSIDCFCAIGHEPMTALWCAATFGNNYKITQLLVKNGAKVHRKDQLSVTLPARAVIQGNFFCFQALYDTWKEVFPDNHAYDDTWNTLLTKVQASQAGR